MKTHEQFAEDLPLYALEELTDADRRELEQHLETCAACRREVQFLRNDLSLLALSSAGPRPPSAFAPWHAAQPSDSNIAWPAAAGDIWFALPLNQLSKSFGSITSM